MRRLKEWLADHWLPVAVGITVIGLVIAALIEHSAQRSCEDRGGRVEHFNHRTILITQSCGSGCFFTVPVETSDWRCVE